MAPSGQKYSINSPGNNKKADPMPLINVFFP